jgi:hypothetical protein
MQMGNAATYIQPREKASLPHHVAKVSQAALLTWPWVHHHRECPASRAAAHGRHPPPRVPATFHRPVPPLAAGRTCQ